VHVNRTGLNDMGKTAKPELLTDYLSPEELGKSLGVCTKTLDRWRLDGGGPPLTKIGRRVYYHRPSAITWMRAQEQAKPSAERKRA
jgi:hypothetical protein